jgi:endonuclease/exonuclease/phosphatase (EEP) superfamily protein YafD
VHSLVRSSARLLVLIVVVPIVLLVIESKVLHVNAWWFELVRYLPYPVLLLPVILAGFGSLLLSWRWRVAILVALLLTLSVLMGLSFGFPDSGSGRVRFMTYNIKAYLATKDGGYPLLAWEIAIHDPDVLVMQDAGVLTARRVESPGTAQAIFDGRQHYSFGQYVVLSRFPLRDCRHEQIPYRGENHTYVRCTFTAHGQDVDLITAHFKSPRDGLNAARHERVGGLSDWQTNFSDRLTQAAKLASEAAQRRRPLVIAGDLNATESSPIMRMLRESGLRDTFSEAGRGYGFTHGHSLRPHISFLRIDHILVSDELGVVESFAGGKEASAHRPMIADLLMRRDSK